MEVYIEDVLLSNLILNFLFVLVSSKILCNRQSFWFLLLGSFAGTVVSVATTFFNLSQVSLVTVKVICGALMTAICVKDFTYKNCVLFFVTLLAVTFLSGGVVLACNLFLGKDLSVMASNVVVGGFLGAVIGLLRVVKAKRKVDGFIYAVEVAFNGKWHKIMAYLDSGNLFQDNLGRTILILDFKTFAKIFGKDFDMVDYLSRSLNKKINGEYLTVKTVGGDSKLFASFDAEVFYKGKKLNAVVGLSNAGTQIQSCRALLSPLAL